MTITSKKQMKQIPFNTSADGCARTIKANYWKASLANYIRGGMGSPSLR